MKKTLLRAVAVWGLSLLSAQVALAADSDQNWPQWRGPKFNGSTEAKNLPATFSPTENVVWAADLPGPSGSTPIVWNDHVFVSSPDAQKNLNLLCFDRKNGKLRWSKTVAIGDKSVGRNNMTAPSPVTDGKTVWVLYATADLAAFDFEGNQRWSRNLGKDYGRFSVMWIYGSSPLLFDGRLYVQVLQRNPMPSDYPLTDSNAERESYLLALDPASGKTLWKQVRATDSTKESQEAYTTPIPFEGPKGWQLAIVGGDHVSVHNAKTGEEFWRARLYDKRDDWYRIVTSPVVHNGLIYASGPKGEPVVALKDGGRGNVTESAVVWKFDEAPTDWSTPLLYDGKLFVLDGGKKTLTRLDPKTGVKKWSGKLETDTLWGSLTGADGKIYVVSEKGTAVVLGAGDEFRVLSKAELGGAPVKSSVAIAQSQLFIRTANKLYCVGSK